MLNIINSSAKYRNSMSVDSEILFRFSKKIGIMSDPRLTPDIQPTQLHTKIHPNPSSR